MDDPLNGTVRATLEALGARVQNMTGPLSELLYPAYQGAA